MDHLDITHHFSSREYAKETFLPMGSEVPQHAHTHDHLAILAAGRALVEVDGVETRYHGPCCIVIEAGKVHKVTALTDVVWYCVWAHGGCTDPERIDETLIAGVTR
jgi:quercetin dioxygenase-like cupin family protein